MPFKVNKPKIIRESDYFFSLESLFEKHPEAHKCVLYVRASTYSQEKKQTPQVQVNFLKKTCRENGIIILDIFSETVSGKCDYIYQRCELRKACEMALENNAFLLTVSVERFLRPANIDKKNHFVPLLDSDMENFKQQIRALLPDKPVV